MAQIFKGYDARRRADLAKIKIALEAYYGDHDCYPVFPLRDANGLPSYVCDSDILAPYLASMPCDPTSKKPYTIYLTPVNSNCPQQYAVYAKIYSFFDKQANNITYCPKTIVVNSSDMRNVDIVYGCSFRQVCYTYYGCVNKACVVVAEDELSTCRYSWCEPDCNNKCSIAKYACTR